MDPGGRVGICEERQTFVRSLSMKDVWNIRGRGRVDA